MPPQEKILENTPSPAFSRRTLAKGVAWAAPVVVASSQIPVYAASTCSTADKATIDKAFSDAQAYAEANYYCNGSPAQMQINFYQPLAMGDGGATDAYVNVKNLSSCSITFTQQYPLRLDIYIRNNNVVTGSNRRSITTVATSWGSKTTTWTANENLSGAPVGSVNDYITWDFIGTLPGTNGGDNEADLRIGFGDGGGGSSTWNDYITVVPFANSGAPTFDSLDVSQGCLDYYNQKLASWVTPFQFYAYGSKTPYSSGNGQAVSAGSVIDTRLTGNNSPWGSASKNGIW